MRGRSKGIPQTCFNGAVRNTMVCFNTMGAFVKLTVIGAFGIVLFVLGQQTDVLEGIGQ